MILTHWQTFWAVVKTLATHRATYKFLALLAVALGFLQGGPLIESLGSVICILVAGGCVAD
ncbi:gp19.5 family protein [Pseudomonas extremaustralis]